MYAKGASGCLRVIEVAEPADIHALAGVSLVDFSEDLRRRLYDQVVADYFAPEVVGEDAYSPDTADLAVTYCMGRWLVGWNRLEHQDGSTEDRSELLRIYSTDRGIVYREV